jgi:uncharacterized protein with HEPN domain
MLSEEIADSLLHILNSAKKIEHRTAHLQKAEELTGNDEAEKLLDSIAMRLQFIGEVVKRIDKYDKSFFVNHPELEWKRMMNFRDFISHHYELLDYQIIFNICKNDIPELIRQAEHILNRESEG